jgi:lysophospholipase L1-like esterase
MIKKYYIHTLFIGICFALFTVCCLLNQSFIKLQHLRTFPIEPLKSFSFDDNKPKLLLLGDSRVSMWPAQLLTSFSLFNLTQGGYTSSQTLLLLKHYENELHLNQIAFIQTCINDIHWLRGMKTLKLSAIQQCKKNIIDIITILRKKNSKIILSTLIPPSQVPLIRWLYWPEDIELIINNLNNFIRNQEHEDVLILDAHNILKDESSNKLDAQYKDSNFFLHINPLGYTKLTEELNKILF